MKKILILGTLILSVAVYAETIAQEMIYSSKTFELWGCRRELHRCPQNTCPPDKMMDDSGKCFSCNAPQMISINCIGEEEANSICPQRKTCATTERYHKNGAIGSYPESYDERCPDPGSLLIRYRCAHRKIN